MKSNPLFHRLFKGIGAASFSQILNIFTQISIVPLFLFFLGVSSYGDWIVLSTIPSYLMMSDLGLLNVAAIQITLEIAKNNKQKALVIFQGTWVFICILNFILFLISFLYLVIPFDKWFNLQTITNSQAISIAFILTLSVLINLQSGSIGAVFRSDGKYIIGIWITTFSKFIEFTAISICLIFGASLFDIALVQLFVRIIVFCIYLSFLNKYFPWIVISFNLQSFMKIKSMILPSLAYMVFPLGNMLKNQGVLMLVSSILGPIAVVALSTVKTLINSTAQFIGVINGSTQIEISSAFASGNTSTAILLNRYSCQVTLWLSLLNALFLSIFGLYIIRVWTLDKVLVTNTFFYLMILVGFVNSIWLSFVNIPIAINRHSKISLYFIILTFLSLIIMNFLLPVLHLNGVAISLLIIDLMLIPITFKLSMNILNDNLFNFLKFISNFPLNLFFNIINSILK